MTQYAIEELRMLNQLFLGLFLAADFAFFLFIYNSQVPWYSLVGAALGLSIIVLCWTGRKYLFFAASLMTFAVVQAIAFNWAAIFSLH